MDRKTAFVEGEADDYSRGITCQIPPEIDYPPYIGARTGTETFLIQRVVAAPTSTTAGRSSKAHPNGINLEGAVGCLVDPVSGRQVHGVTPLNVDDLLMAGDDTVRISN